MFVPAVKPRARAASRAAADNAAVFHRYAKRDAKGRVEWIQWADLELAAAWAREGLRVLDAFVAKHTRPVDDARVLEGGGRSAIVSEALAVLRTLNDAFQALNVPPIVVGESDELGKVDLLRSFVVLREGRVEVRTIVVLGAGRANAAQEAMAALWRRVGARALSNDESVVVDDRSRALLFRGTFDAGIAFKQRAADKDRAYLALWARRPWAIDRGDDVELVSSEPGVWERERIVRKLQLARPFFEAIANDPWAAVGDARARVRAHNDTLADEWAGQVPELFSTATAIGVNRLRQVMNALAQARTERALNQARAQAREGLATGVGSAVGVLGAISAVAPPAALVLAPAAAALSAVAALAGLLLQVIPREWMATAETVPPRLPLASMISGDESQTERPVHQVAAPAGFVRGQSVAEAAPASLDTEQELANTTMHSTLATPTTAAPLPVRRSVVPSSVVDTLLAPVSLSTSDGRTTISTDRDSSETTRSVGFTPSDARAGQPATATQGVVLVGLGLGAMLALGWLAQKE